MALHDTRWRGGQNPEGPVIDMTPDGQFATPARPSSVLPAQVFGVAILVAVVAGAGAIALLALWLAFTLLPIAIGAALIAYGLFRFRLWRARQASGGSFGRQRDIFRP